MAAKGGGPWGAAGSLAVSGVEELIHRFVNNAGRRGKRRGASRARASRPQHPGLMSSSYQNMPVTQSYVQRQGAPEISRAGDGVVVTHTEFLGDVTHTVPFTVTEYELNPGLANIYTWLATMAKDYQEYHVLSFQIRYVSKVNAISEGTVYMAYDYNVMDSPPPDEGAITAYKGMMEFPPWTASAAMEVCTRTVIPNGRKFLRSGNRGGDIKLYDFAKLLIATSSADAAHANNPCGKLFMDYTIALRTPQVDIVAPIGSSTSTILSTVFTPVTLGVETIIPFDSHPSTSGGLVINPLRITLAPDGTFTLPNGRYMLWGQVEYHFTVSGTNNARLDFDVGGVTQFRACSVGSSTLPNCITIARDFFIDNSGVNGADVCSFSFITGGSDAIVQPSTSCTITAIG